MPAALTDITQARRMILERAVPLEPEPVALADALGRTLAADVLSAEAVPGFDNAALDGYAIRTRDSGARRIVGESRAGTPSATAIASGEAIAISTGAMIPAGADAIARLEDVTVADGDVHLNVPVAPGTAVRRRGEDLHSGTVALRAGRLLGPFELGVLASVGAISVSCIRRPRVALVVTGDELLASGEPMRPGAVRDTHSHTLPPLARGAGAVVTDVVRAPDDADATLAALRRALDADVAITCGGVSVGAHDHVRPAFAAAGVQEQFWGVALRPGMPTCFGVGDGLVFGLPGNPVSAIVTFLLFVRPALLALGGRDPEAVRTTAVLDDEYAKAAGRAHALRCRLRLADDGWHAALTREQGSHIIGSTLGADCLAMIAADVEHVKPGDRVTVERIAPWT